MHPRDTLTVEWVMGSVAERGSNMTVGFLDQEADDGMRSVAKLLKPREGS